MGLFRLWCDGGVVPETSQSLQIPKKVVTIAQPHVLFARSRSHPPHRAESPLVFGKETLTQVDILGRARRELAITEFRSRLRISSQVIYGLFPRERVPMVKRGQRPVRICGLAVTSRTGDDKGEGGVGDDTNTKGLEMRDLDLICWAD